MTGNAEGARPAADGEPRRDARADGAPTARASPVEVADRALEQRPLFTFRMQVYISVLLLFVTVIVVAVTTISTTTNVQQEARLFEQASRLLFEIEQARRFEKNYFLHGTNLDDAVENVTRAQAQLRRDADVLSTPHTRALRGDLSRHLARYAALLKGQLRRQRAQPGAEAMVRTHGRRLVNLAAALHAATRQTLDAGLVRSRWLQYGLMAFLLLYISAMTYVLVRRIVAPIRRLMEHTRRIAAGDHTPIMPARRYRDEFTALAVSINDMLAELDRRQDILVASHKLRAVGTLTAGVAHELNNPINNITLTAHVMRQDFDLLDEAERLELVEDIVNEAERTKQIVKGLLDFTRQSESQVEPIDLSRLVQETVALTKHQLNLKGARAEVNVTPHLPLVHGDSEQLSQVVLNLLLNAVDVTDRGGVVAISVQHNDEGFLEVEIRDHGPGIADHVLPFIFDPFFTTKARSKGTGLGLAICKGIIKKHGGDLFVRTRLEEGSTFTICLPVTSIPVDFNAMGEHEDLDALAPSTAD